MTLPGVVYGAFLGAGVAHFIGRDPLAGALVGATAAVAIERPRTAARIMDAVAEVVRKERAG